MKKLQTLQGALWRLMQTAYERGDLEIPMGQDLYHLVGTVPLAALLAERRGVDKTLATAAMLLHDAGRLLTGSMANHQVSGLGWAEANLLQAGFSRAEADTICRAIATHNEKEKVGCPLEEVVRDADVLEVYLSGGKVPPSFQERIKHLRAELGIRVAVGVA